MSHAPLAIACFDCRVGIKGPDAVEAERFRAEHYGHVVREEGRADRRGDTP